MCERNIFFLKKVFDAHNLVPQQQHEPVCEGDAPELSKDDLAYQVDQHAEKRKFDF